MVGINELKPHLFSLVRMAQKKGFQIDFHYKDRVYIMTVTPTDQLYKQPKRLSRPQKTGIQLTTRNCPNCKSMMVNGLCLSTTCGLKL